MDRIRENKAEQEMWIKRSYTHKHYIMVLVNYYMPKGILKSYSFYIGLKVHVQNLAKLLETARPWYFNIMSSYLKQLDHGIS